MRLDLFFLSIFQQKLIVHLRLLRMIRFGPVYHFADTSMQDEK